MVPPFCCDMTEGESCAFSCAICAVIELICATLCVTWESAPDCAVVSPPAVLLKEFARFSPAESTLCCTAELEGLADRSARLEEKALSALPMSLPVFEKYVCSCCRIDDCVSALPCREVCC